MSETMAKRSEVGYFIFDVESIADGALIANVKYPEDQLSADEAVRRYRDELLDESDGKRDFIPYTFQVPIAVVIAKVAHDFSLLDVVSLDEPQFRAHVMTHQFWKGWEVYQHPTWVTFNGRSFDMPLMELAAYRFGCSLGNWFAPKTKSFDQPRNRYNTKSHLDLLDVLTNSGACRFHGGLNLAAELIGKPGKMCVEGYMVQDMYDAGDLQGISDYCRCDVLDTYFVFLRCAVLRGELTLEQEVELVAKAKAWINERAAETPAFQQYLAAWRDWQNPWQQATEVALESNSADPR
jgi:predicted PolB exonuclease-like 3'-5' exonuclease